MKLRIHRQKIKLEQCLMIFFSVFMYFDWYCYLTWSTLNNHLVNLLVRHVREAVVLALFICALYGKRDDKGRNISGRTLYAIIIFFILIAFLTFNNYSWKSGYITIVAAFTIILLDREQREYIFKASLIAFALMILPSMIYYLLDSIGVGLAHTTLLSNQLAKYKRGWTYAQYPFGLITHESNFGQIDRYCGIFDESGYIGSLAALFIAGGYGKVNKKWIILLMIEGLFSFSMAFYLLLIIFLIVRAFISGAVKLGIILAVIILSINLFINIDFNNPSMAHIQERVDFTSLFLVKDNRTSNRSDKELSNIFKTDGVKLLFGYGHDAANNNPLIYGSSSYKMFFYDYGIIGTMLFGLYFVSISLIKKVNLSALPFIIVFLASFYQRPYVFTVVYITIFAGAISMHSEKKTIEEKKHRKKYVFRIKSPFII